LVTAGFIVEGDSEAILLKDSSFISLLASLNITCSAGLIINAEGKNNLYNPKADFSRIERKINAWVQRLKANGAQAIFMLIDFDASDTCFTFFKSKVFSYDVNFVIIAKQALEAWYLADQQALSAYLKTKIFVATPESYLSPFDEIRNLRLMHNNKGLSDKKYLTKDIIKSGFSLPNAAAHPNCPSAAYFLGKLQSLNNLP
jgi:hypothetical protein